MINLEVIATKIGKILNGIDLEIPSGVVSPSNDNFFFRVFSEGLYLSENYDAESGKNFIPVVVGAYGGENNPVEGLGEQNRNVMIQLYFPVRFKSDMYALEEYLDSVFVGRVLTFGTQKAVCNVSPAQYGELQDFDFVEFSKWIENVYQHPIEKMETYMAMSVTLYLSSANPGFVYGNDAVAQLTIDGVSSSDLETWFDDDTTATTETLVFASHSLQSNSDPAIQQLMGSSESAGLPVGTSYGSSFSVYVKDSPFYRYLINKWFGGNSQTLTLTLNLTLLGQTYTKTCFIQSVNLILQKGELVTITFAFVKKVVLS